MCLGPWLGGNHPETCQMLVLSACLSSDVSMNRRKYGEVMISSSSTITLPNSFTSRVTPPMIDFRSPRLMSLVSICAPYFLDHRCEKFLTPSTLSASAGSLEPSQKMKMGLFSKSAQFDRLRRHFRSVSDRSYAKTATGAFTDLQSVNSMRRSSVSAGADHRELSYVFEVKT
jgi:hypothetical protein